MFLSFTCGLAELALIALLCACIEFKIISYLSYKLSIHTVLTVVVLTVAVKNGCLILVKVTNIVITLLNH